MLYDACFRSAFHQMVSGLVPIPGGAGISEFVYNSMFSGFFVETYAMTETGLTLVRTGAGNVMATQVLWRIATFYLVLIASGLVAAFYRSRSNKNERFSYSNRQTFVDFQLENREQRQLPNETLFETKQLSRKEISKRLNAEYLAHYGLLTGDDYIGPDAKHSKKKTDKIHLED